MKEMVRTDCERVNVLGLLRSLREFLHAAAVGGVLVESACPGKDRSAAGAPSRSYVASTAVGDVVSLCPNVSPRTTPRCATCTLWHGGSAGPCASHSTSVIESLAVLSRGRAGRRSFTC
jgi:hypothetical protein